MKNIIHRLCEDPFLSDLIRSIVEAGSISVKHTLKAELGNPKKVIDIACGTGQFSVLVKGDYIGIDLDRKHISYAKRRYGSDNRKFLVRNALKTGFGDKTFDCSLVLSCLHHIPDNLIRELLDEVSRVTKEKILIVDLVPLKYNPIGKFLYRMDQGKNIRAFEEQKRLVAKHLRIKKAKMFRSGIYMHSFFVCSPISAGKK